MNDYDIAKLQGELVEAREMSRSLQEELKLAGWHRQMVGSGGYAVLERERDELRRQVEFLQARISDCETVREAYRASWKSAQATIEVMAEDLKAFRERVLK